MLFKTKPFNFLAVIIVIVLLSSCGLFRKKNRCNDCPKWSKTKYHIKGIEQNIKHV